MNSSAPSFVVVPMHTVTSNDDRFSDADDALLKAKALVEKDRKPRAIVQVVAEVRATQTPRVDVTVRQRES